MLQVLASIQGLVGAAFAPRHGHEQWGRVAPAPAAAAATLPQGVMPEPGPLGWAPGMSRVQRHAQAWAQACAPAEPETEPEACDGADAATTASTPHDTGTAAADPATDMATAPQ